MKPTRHLIFVAAVWLVLAGAATAGETFDADRPDESESAEVVGAGRFQIETSFKSQRLASGEHLTTTPTLLRLGVADAWELRLETDGWARLGGTGGSGGMGATTGMSDISLGVKWHMQDGDDDDFQPSVAWLAHLDVPSGASAFRAPGLRPSLRMVAEWELGHDWSLSVMPGVFSARDEAGARYAGGILAVALGRAFTPRFKGFVEVASEQIASGRHGGTEWLVDGGLIYMLGPWTQLDVALYKGLSGDAPRSGWTVGLSVRY